MPTIRELRERQGVRTDEGTGFVSLILGAIAAFAVGALLVVGWQVLPSMTGMFDEPGKAVPSFASAGKRIGIAARAPMLRICMASGGAGIDTDDFTPAAFYGLLQASDSVSRVSQFMGKQGALAPSTFTLAWGEIADCVYRQNGRMLCDPNNRAFAVEAAVSLVRQADLVASPQRSDSFAKGQGAEKNSSAKIERDLERMRDIKQRVLTALRARLQEGRLIAADFGTFPSGEIKRALQENKPTRDACAEDGMQHAQPTPVTMLSGERKEEEARQRIRNPALQGLGRPSSSFCTKEGHQWLINALNHYFGKRALYERAAAEHGPESEREARQGWQTADDKRIERLTREAYARGHFKPDQLRPDLRATVAKLVRDERVTGRPCAG
jgi:hypothetical protein